MSDLTTEINERARGQGFAHAMAPPGSALAPRAYASVVCRVRDAPPSWHHHKQQHLRSKATTTGSCAGGLSGGCHAAAAAGGGCRARGGQGRRGGRQEAQARQARVSERVRECVQAGGRAGTGGHRGLLRTAGWAAAGARFRPQPPTGGCMLPCQCCRQCMLPPVLRTQAVEDVQGGEGRQVCAGAREARH